MWGHKNLSKTRERKGKKCAKIEFKKNDTIPWFSPAKRCAICSMAMATINQQSCKQFNSFSWVAKRIRASVGCMRGWVTWEGRVATFYLLIHWWRLNFQHRWFDGDPKKDHFHWLTSNCMNEYTPSGHHTGVSRRFVEPGLPEPKDRRVWVNIRLYQTICNKNINWH